MAKGSKKKTPSNELTDEQIRQEEQFLKGLPRLNLGAFFMPGIWGPAHGFWISILFYPLWLVADYLIYGAYYNPTVVNILLAIFIIVATIGVTAVFSIVCQPIAAHHAEEAGVSRERYLKRQRIWAVICIILAIAAISWATYYNINIRDGW